ncbi:hypothetical protein BO85DRAFT_114550 [Aspergillus piperis CBS 112811]|uniref:C2H2-type domain-containing protein n=1 Tax=Aspergillus piperis CBS 112811 TaxID=1448313 RepID=A0A8G1RE97_9EURO|nr:hypothetical protein BO85DRAFT_114550 [Aspergillus piperis CBS 112811]RAH61690.1 hypothetical protein BO85DRAFT_114550 [Aspergillus piperis CBS 112811]
MQLRRREQVDLYWSSRHWNPPSRYPTIPKRAVFIPELSPSRSHRESPPVQPTSEAKQDNSSSSSLFSPIVLKFEELKALHSLSRLSWADTSSRRDAEHLAFPPAPIELILHRLQPLKDIHIATEKAFLRGNTSNSRGDTPPIPSMFSKGQRDWREIRLLDTKLDLEREWSMYMEGAKNVICPYCRCDLSSSVAMNREKWRPRWRCAARAHGVLVFWEKSEYEEHMRRKHKSTQPQLAILAERSSRPSGPVFQSCPLCGEGNRADLEEHIADHLTYLALMSIPLPNKSQSTDDHMEMAANLSTDQLRAGGAGRTDSYHSFDESEMEKPGDPSKLPEFPFAGFKHSKQKNTKGKAPLKERILGELHESENAGFFPGRCKWMGCTESQIFEGEEELFRHILARHGKHYFCCLVKGCDKTFADRRELQKHLGTDHNYGLIKEHVIMDVPTHCQWAGCTTKDSFTITGSLYQHIRNMHL